MEMKNINLPLIALRGMTVLPDMVIHFDISRKKSFHGVEKAMEKDTGARALRAIIEEFMLDIMYEIPKDDNIGMVTITKEYVEKKGGPLIMMRGCAQIAAVE